MALGMRTVFETANFKVTKLRNGTSVEDRLTGKEVYFQPGDDEMTFLTALEAIEEEHPANKWDILRDIVCGDYF